MRWPPKPLHTLIASMAMRDDTLWSVLGCMGADGQPQIHLQANVAMIDPASRVRMGAADPRSDGAAIGY